LGEAWGAIIAHTHPILIFPQKPKEKNTMLRPNLNILKYIPLKKLKF